MDVHMHNSRTLHYGPKRFSEDDLRFLSLEERECILFFEDTIGSLEEDDERTGTLAVERPASYTQTARHHSPVDHDIIDLVHPTPHPNNQKDVPPIRPDFPAPDTYYEVNTKPATPAQEVVHQPPAGPANKIAEHEGIPSQRRSSLESPQNPSVKHGPPTHTKPTRLPNSIGVLLGSRDSIPHSIAAEAASAQERREQKLANLSGPAHPLDGGEPSCVRKLPTRSISFRDPTPDISRMEALSKLGLDQRRSQSIMHTSTSESLKTAPFKSASPANASAPDHKPKSSPAPILTSAEVTHTDFNSYGGKSIMLNPSASFRTEHVSPTLPKMEAAPEVHANNFGGRSRVMSTPEANHGVRSKTFFPSEDLAKRKASHAEALVRIAQPPAPAPRPQRHQTSPAGPRSTEMSRKPAPKQSFRAQGITVQFSGKGATDEARRNALRKLGLLRDTP